MGAVGQARWTPVVRLIAVLAVVSGLALVFTPRCAAGMLPAEMPCSVGTVGTIGEPHPTGSMTGTGRPDRECGSAVVSDRGTVLLADGSAAPLMPDAGSGGRQPGDALVTCLAVLVVIVVGLVGLSPPRRSRLTFAAVAEVAATVWSTSRAHPDGLARLCVLRI